MPPLPEAERHTSVHPNDLPADPPPTWARDDAYVESRDDKRFVVASGSAGDAGNRPQIAFRKAEAEARAKLDAWLAGEDARCGAARIVENRVGLDGRAYVRLEAELDSDG